MVKETTRFFIGVVIFCAVLVGMATLLTGCSKDDFQYAGCIVRDRTSNPCN